MGNTGSKLSNKTDENWSVAAKYKVIGCSAGDGLIQLSPNQSVHYNFKSFPVNIYFKHGSHNASETAANPNMQSWCNGIWNKEWKLSSPHDGLIELYYGEEHQANYTYETRNVYAARMRREREQRVQDMREKMQKEEWAASLIDKKAREEQQNKFHQIQESSRRTWQNMSEERDRALDSIGRESKEFKDRCRESRQERETEREKGFNNMKKNRDEVLSRMRNQQSRWKIDVAKTIEEEQKEADEIRKRRQEKFAINKKQISEEISRKFELIKQEGKEHRDNLETQFNQKREQFEQTAQEKQNEMTRCKQEMEQRISLQNSKLADARRDFELTMAKKEAEIDLKIKESRLQIERNRQEANVKRSKILRQEVAAAIERDTAIAIRKAGKETMFLVKSVQGKELTEHYKCRTDKSESEVKIKDRLGDDIEEAVADVLNSLSRTTRSKETAISSASLSVNYTEILAHCWMSRKAQPFSEKSLDGHIELLKLLTGIETNDKAAELLKSINHLLEIFCPSVTQLDVTAFCLLVIYRLRNIKEEKSIETIKRELDKCTTIAKLQEKILNELSNDSDGFQSGEYKILLLQFLGISEDVLNRWPVPRGSIRVGKLRACQANLLRNFDLAKCLEMKADTERMVELITSMDNWDFVSMLELMQVIATSEAPSKTLREFVKMLALNRCNPEETLLSVSEGVTDNTIQLLRQKQASEKTLEQLILELRDEGMFDEYRLQQLKTPVEKVLAYLKNNSTIKKLIQSATEKSSKLNFWSKFKSEKKPLDEVLIKLCKAVFLCKKYTPRHTQIFSVAALLENSSQNLGQILRILTGEGKSCIVAMTAVGLLLLGKESVDIVAPSEILAHRDCEEWKDFYEHCGITVACNINSKKPRECYKSSVIYGTVASFAGDILRHEFQFKEIRGSRGFDSIIVDEVDSLLLDQGVQMTYLAQNAGDMKMLDPIFPTIFRATLGCNVLNTVGGGEMVAEQPITFPYLIKEFVNSETELNDVFEKLVNKRLLASDDRELFFPTDAKLSVDLSNFSAERISRILAEIKGLQPEFPKLSMFTVRNQKIEPVPLTHYKATDTEEVPLLLLIMDNGMCRLLFSDIEQFRSIKRKDIQSRIDYSTTLVDKSQAKEYNEKDSLPMPQHLEKFINDMLDVWINSALTATVLQPGRDYLLQGGDAVPVDYKHTGVVQENMRWSDGLQQFIQLKHNLQMRPLGLETNFLSNMAFFRRYGSAIFGVSGTLGEEHEKTFMQETFNMRLNYIPPYKERRLRENPGIVTSTNSEFVTKLCQMVNKESSRPTLIVCEDINCAMAIQEEVTQKCPGIRCRQYTKNEDTKAELEVGPGDVVVATNLAGRGTDVKVGDEAEKAGGLHVLVTFLPLNQRVEEQVFGRSGRKGQRGSATLLLSRESLPACFADCDSVEEMKDVRREASIHELRNHKEFALEEVKFKEALFERFSQMLSEYRASIKEDPDLKMKLDYIKEVWGMHLKTTLCHLTDFRIKKVPFKEVEIMFRDAKANAEAGCSISPFQALKFADKNMRHGNFDKAIDILTTAIAMNSSWSAVAYYNRAYCKLMNGDSSSQGVTEDLNEAKNRIQETWMTHAMWTLLYSGARIDTEGNSGSNTDAVSEEANQSKKSELSLKNTSTEPKNAQFRQCAARIKIIEKFMAKIEANISKLKELQDANEDIAAMSICIKDLEKDPDSITKDELDALYQLGHVRLFDVKKKPEYLGALLVTVLGALELAIGGVLCWVGIANVGGYLVSEGMNNLMTGVLGLIKGEFDMTAWAIGKLKNIGKSILTMGFGKVIAFMKSSSTFKAIAQNSQTYISKVSSCVASGINKFIGSQAVNYILSVMDNPVFQKFSGMVSEILQKKFIVWLIEKIKEQVCKTISRQCQQEAETGRLNDMVISCTAKMCLIKNEETSKFDTCDFSLLKEDCLINLIATFRIVIQNSAKVIMEEAKNLDDLRTMIKSKLVMMRNDFSEKVFKALSTLLKLSEMVVEASAIGFHSERLKTTVASIVKHTENAISSKKFTDKLDVSYEVDKIQKINVEKLQQTKLKLKEILEEETTNVVTTVLKEMVQKSAENLLNSGITACKNNMQNHLKNATKNNDPSATQELKTENEKNEQISSVTAKTNPKIKNEHQSSPKIEEKKKSNLASNINLKITARATRESTSMSTRLNPGIVSEGNRYDCIG